MDRVAANRKRSARATAAPEQAELALVDRCFRLALAPLGLRELDVPAMLPLGDMERLRFFEQFPRQGVITDRRGRPAVDITTGTHVLLPSACYPIYLALADRTLDGPVHAAAVGRCFRWIDEGEIRRLRVFVQRKVVFFGTAAHVREQLGRARAAIRRLAATAGIDARVVPAPPPADLREIARALFAVDDTLEAGGVTLAQFNFHRQHYAQLCGTRTSDGRIAFGACIGLLHEPWLAALARSGRRVADVLVDLAAAKTTGGADVSPLGL